MVKTKNTQNMNESLQVSRLSLAERETLKESYLHTISMEHSKRCDEIRAEYLSAIQQAESQYQESAQLVVKMIDSVLTPAKQIFETAKENALIKAKEAEKIEQEHYIFANSRRAVGNYLRTRQQFGAD